ncbi:prepilin peptidase [Actinomycetales bacterium SN12]|nr:prepilin peptidase [Actinomycetales bacterium SN12]
MSAMTAYVIVVIGILGLLIGSFLNVVAYRVPAGISLMRPSQCSSCDAPVRPWQNVPVLSWIALRGRCAWCGERISARYPLVELAAGALFALAAWWWVTSSRPGSSADPMALPTSLADAWTQLSGADSWIAPTAASGVALLAWLWFIATGFVLAIIDIETRRLPRGIVRTALVAVGPLLALSCALGADWWAFVRAVLSMLVLYIAYALLWLVKPGGMGGGDVRLAALIGLMLGWFGWGPLIVGAFAAFVLGGVYGITLMLGGRATRRTAVPFGPWMIVGAVVGAVAGSRIGEWYLSLLTVG